MVDSNKVRREICQFLKISEDKAGDQAVLTDLVRESFVLVEMVMYLQDELGVQLVQEDLKAVQTVGDLIRAMQAKDSREEKNRK